MASLPYNIKLSNVEIVLINVMAEPITALELDMFILLAVISESMIKTAPPALLSDLSFKKFELDILILGFEAS